MTVSKENQTTALAFAERFRVFSDDARGRDLLSHWERTVLSRVLPSNASHGEVMFFEGQRAFVLNIKQQLQQSFDNTLT